jgi:hypothetical protein
MSDSVRVGRPEAAAVIWKKSSADDLARSAAAARLAASLRAAVSGIFSVGLIYFDQLAIGLVALGIGIFTLSAGLASPLRVYAAMDRAVLALGRAAAALLSWLLLAPVFFLVLAPFGLLAKRGARDPLKRGLDAKAETYWRDRDAPRDLKAPY